MSSEELNMSNVRANVRAWALEAFREDPENTDYDDRCHDDVDGCEYVIYYYQARYLWFTYSEVRDLEDEIEGYLGEDADIDTRIQCCVYLFLRSLWIEAWEELAANHCNTETNTGVAS